ncbi:type III-B CRISPR module RAMP protein Cmr4 [candidate division KSB1 bacterium]|nr:type III-B CRISPR module RAMP protein Cmr4 [candidate division KSB1 bacterium]
MNQVRVNPYLTRQYFGFAIDPIHVGTGSYRLAGVDNSIMRDPATNLPKIPGSSLSGVTRSNSSLRFQEQAFKCAGKGGEGDKQHCGKVSCPICVSFGFSKGDEQSLSGMAQFFDAQIILFPVYTMYGTVWMTSRSILADKNMPGLPEEQKLEQVVLVDNFMNRPAPPQKINMSWLFLDVHEIKIDSQQIKNALFDIYADTPCVNSRINAILNRLVIVHDNLFSRLVNDNLEVRTSVSIDPTTGAADDGALFNYEAIPRTTFFEYEVVYNDPQHFRIGDETPSLSQDDVIQTVERGMLDFALTGVGGMNTRGMGRLELLNIGIERS